MQISIHLLFQRNAFLCTVNVNDVESSNAASQKTATKYNLLKLFTKISTWFLYPCSNNDVISSARKHYCALGLGFEFGLVEILSVKCVFEQV